MPLPLRPLTLPRLMPLPLRLTPLLLRLMPLPLRRLRPRSSNRSDYCFEPSGSMTARAVRNHVCPGFVFFGGTIA
jgi:hypothetical protein